MQTLTDDQLFKQWQDEPNNIQVNSEILSRKVNANGTKCGFCQGTNSWSGPITSCGCIDWND